MLLTKHRIFFMGDLMDDGRRHPAQSTGEPHAGWPAGVRPISMDGIDHLGVGDDGTLYWDGKPVEVRKSLTLTTMQKVGALAVAASAIVGAGAAAVSAYAEFMSIGR